MSHTHASNFIGSSCNQHYFSETGEFVNIL